MPLFMILLHGDVFHAVLLSLKLCVHICVCMHVCVRVLSLRGLWEVEVTSLIGSTCFVASPLSSEWSPSECMQSGILEWR